MKKVVILIIFCIAINAVRSQSTTLLEYGRNGFGGMFSGLQGSDYLGLEYKIGFTYKGILDVVPSYTQRIYEPHKKYVGGEDPKSFSKSLTVSYWFLNTSFTENIHLRLGLSGGIELSTYDNYKYIEETLHFVKYEESMGGNLGFTTLVNFNLAGKFKIQPNLRFAYFLGTRKTSDIYRSSANESYKSSQTSLGIICAKQFGKDFHLFISMNQALLSEYKENYFQFGGGFVFEF